MTNFCSPVDKLEQNKTLSTVASDLFLIIVMTCPRVKFSP